MKHMKSKIEIDQFYEGRLMLRVRFPASSNFWIEDNGQATWVPTLKEADLLIETLHVINEYNLIKQASKT